MRKDRPLPALAAGLLSLTLGSCAANTIYRGVAVTALSDEELVAELLSTDKGYGIQLNRGMYLMAVRPEPAYVLTSRPPTQALGIFVRMCSSENAQRGEE